MKPLIKFSLILPYTQIYCVAAFVRLIFSVENAEAFKSAFFLKFDFESLGEGVLAHQQTRPR